MYTYIYTKYICSMLEFCHESFESWEERLVRVPPKMRARPWHRLIAGGGSSQRFSIVLVCSRSFVVAVGVFWAGALAFL